MVIVQHLDNTMTAVSVPLKYKMEVGTEYSKEVTHHIGVLATVGAEIKANLGALFEKKLQLSVTTGYDWTQSSKDVWTEVR